MSRRGCGSGTRRSCLVAAASVASLLIMRATPASSQTAAGLKHWKPSPPPSPCDPSIPYQFCFSHDLYSSDTGYYRVAGHKSVGAPELEMEIGKTYTFDQTDETNWFHPIGFAYYPNGAHNGRDEILDDAGCDPAFCASKAGARCTAGCDKCKLGCDSWGAVKYRIDAGWKGRWEDVGLASNTGTNATTFVPGYEPEFFIPKDEWLGKHYQVQLTITQAVLNRAKGGELFYFCHIHNRMSGRIRIRGPANKFSGVPPALSLPHEPAPLDVQCGTYLAAAYADARPCGGPTSMLCGAGAVDGSRFSRCLAAINCKMMLEMRVSAAQPGTDPSMALFMQQMIPHHANAVNMAKILMKEVDDGTLNPPSAEMGAHMTTMLYAIVNTQNYQIHQMEAYLADMHSPRGSTICAAPSSALPTVPTLSAAPAVTAKKLPNATKRWYTVLHDTFSSRAHAGNYRIIAPYSRKMMGGTGDAGASPTLRLVLGSTYTFDQSEHTNWYHPLAFGLGSRAQLTGLSSSIAAAALQYKIDGKNVSATEYAARFKYPKAQWGSEHTYVVTLMITTALAKAASASGLYYFSAPHKGLDWPGYISIDGSIELRAAPHATPQSALDVACGTSGLAQFRPGGGRCNRIASVMMCDSTELGSGGAPVLDTWVKQCFAAAGCKMVADMHAKVPLREGRAVTFVRQMIPHHMNAINMAKAALKLQSKRVGETWDEMGVMMYNMINTQTAQIVFMQSYLTASGAGTYVMGHTNASSSCTDTAMSSGGKASNSKESKPQASPPPPTRMPTTAPTAPSVQAPSQCQCPRVDVTCVDSDRSYFWPLVLVFVLGVAVGSACTVYCTGRARPIHFAPSKAMTSVDEGAMDSNISSNTNNPTFGEAALGIRR